MKKQPKVLYTNLVNLDGLYSKEPIKCPRKNSYSGKRFWYCNKTGSIHAYEKHEKDDNIIQFTSPNKKEVELWTKGAAAVMEMLKRWSK